MKLYEIDTYNEPDWLEAVRLKRAHDVKAHYYDVAYQQFTKFVDAHPNTIIRVDNHKRRIASSFKNYVEFKWYPDHYTTWYVRNDDPKLVKHFGALLNKLRERHKEYRKANTDWESYGLMTTYKYYPRQMK